MIARYGDYVAAVQTGDLPAYTGELLGSRIQNVLRGVNSARLYIKQANERAERRLLEVETLGALRTLSTRQRFPVADFRLAWRQLLKCQPHDSICGCSCDEVHRDMLVRYEQLERMISQLERRALERVRSRQAAGAGVVNLLPYRRRGLVELPGMAPATVELDGFSARSDRARPERAPGAPPRSRTTAPRSRATCIRVEAAPDGTLTCSTSRPAGGSSACTGSRTSPTSATSTTSARSTARRPGAASPPTARVLRDGPVVHELELRLTGGDARAERDESSG